MSITINGTTGIAGVDGSAATPSVQGADANTGVFFPAADTVAVTTAGTERITIGSTGVLTLKAVGVEGGDLRLNNIGDASVGLFIDVSVANNGRVFQTENNSTLQLGQLGGTGGIVTLYTAATERLRIDSAGQIGIGGANYGTSGQVLTSGGSGAAPSWTSAALGSTTVTNKTGSRATATTYQNTTNGWLLVCYCMSNNGVTFLIGSTSGLGITALSSNFSGNVQTYLVPPGWYYRATGTVLSNWTEGQA
jgi:hypothetical protein